MLKQGILLLAIGNPYYGRMAYNLAISIKAIDTNAHISLIYTHDAIAHINNKNIWVFDKLIHYTGDQSGFGAKLQLYQYSPYEKTLYIDVDTLWVNKNSPNVLLDQLEGVSFTGITEGVHDYGDTSKSDHSKNYYFWADLEELKERYAFEKEKIFQWRSEFMYFEKCEKINNLFSIARNLYAINSDKSRVDKLKSAKLFCGHIPDELAINISCAMCDITPHIYKWEPSFWDRLNGGNCPAIDVLSSKYYIISCGSNANGGPLKKVYDRTMRNAAYKLRLQHVFPLVSKKEMLNDRQLM